MRNFCKNDIQRGKILLRAIDIMDEYSQKKAENMEAATEPMIEMGLELASFAGLGLGAFAGSFKPIGQFFARFANFCAKIHIKIKIQTYCTKK